MHTYANNKHVKYKQWYLKAGNDHIFFIFETLKNDIRKYWTATVHLAILTPTRTFNEYLMKEQNVYIVCERISLINCL